VNSNGLWIRESFYGSVCASLLGAYWVVDLDFFVCVYYSFLALASYVVLALQKLQRAVLMELEEMKNLSSSRIH
jgi:hypothetical protein